MKKKKKAFKYSPLRSPFRLDYSDVDKAFMRDRPDQAADYLQGLMGEQISDFGDMEFGNLAEGMTNPYADFTNPYADINATNPYSNITNPYEKMKNPYANLDMNVENVYEDLTVNQQQAQFQSEEGAQQRADLLSKGRAGGGNTQGLAQMLANQGAKQTRQISADIGQQETGNQRLKAQGAGDVQKQRKAMEMQKLQGAYDVDKMQAQGAFDISKMKAQGEQYKTQTQMQIAQGGFQAEQLVAQGDWQQQQALLQGAQDKRNLELQQTQGMISILGGQLAGAQQADEDSKSWWEKTFG